MGWEVLLGEEDGRTVEGWRARCEPLGSESEAIAGGSSERRASVGRASGERRASVGRVSGECRASVGRASGERMGWHNPSRVLSLLPSLLLPLRTHQVEPGIIGGNTIEMGARLPPNPARPHSWPPPPLATGQAGPHRRAHDRDGRQVRGLLHFHAAQEAHRAARRRQAAARGPAQGQAGGGGGEVELSFRGRRSRLVCIE